jgi:uncharacterized protein
MDDHIVVQGRAQSRVMPDRAVLHVTVDGEAGSRDDAYRRAARSATRLDEVLATRSGALDRVTTAALLVQPKTRWHKGESVRSGWQASRRSVIEVVDLDVLGDLIAELTGAEAQVVGPSWHLDPTNPAHVEVRSAAAADARSRAEAYAAALGLAVTGVAWVAEPGLSAPRRAVPASFGAPPAGATRGGGAPEIVEITVEELTVEAAVEVGFAFTAT